ncbi:MAG TPA: serine/threonine protein phosphatase, partial [Sphingobacteriaceae bacterium]|nr:serine/threonine protein phosphatase [Sphingobacteriaceae bacterium]
ARLFAREGDDFCCVAQFGGNYEDKFETEQMCLELQHFQDIQMLSHHHNSLLNTYDFFVPVVHKENMEAFVLIGDFNIATELLDNDLNLIQTLINMIVVALENKKLFEERIQGEFLQREIKLAREVQNMLIPLRLPIDKLVDVGALYMPSQNIGGDYFDFIRLNKHEFLWCIADVSGKGVAAALLMANLQANLKALVAVEHDLKKLIVKLNHILAQNTKGDRFITLFMGKYNQQTRQMQYVNAGHNPPVLIMNDDAFLLKEGTVIIGAFEELPFINIGSVKLLPDSLICNYTDGLTDSADEDVFIQDDELIKHIKMNRHLSADLINKNLLRDVQASYQAKMDSDDITLLTMKIA